jgi:hypothetical protein
MWENGFHPPILWISREELSVHLLKKDYSLGAVA